MRDIDAPMLGRELRIPLTKKSKQLYWLAVSLVLLAVVSWGAGQSVDNKRAVLRVGAIALLGCSAYVAVLSRRIDRFRDFEIRIGRDTITMPTYPLWRQRVREIRYSNIEDVVVRHEQSGTAVFLVSQGSQLRVPLGLIPAEWASREIPYRIYLRWQLARNHAMNPGALAAAEAQVLAGFPTFGAVVVEREGEPSVIGVLEHPDDLANLTAPLPGDFKLYMPTDGLAPFPDWR